MRRRLKLAVILPVLFCGIEGLLWYWDIHSAPTIPSPGGFWHTPAEVIGLGLEFPASIVAGLITVPFGDRLRGPLLNGFLLVAGLWYLIGNWFDRRGEVDVPSKPKGLLSSFVFPSFVLAFGAFRLWISFQWNRHGHLANFIQTIQIALIQTWAVFLIGIPAVGIVRDFLDIRREEVSSDSPSLLYRRISNFRLLEMIVGVFAILVLLWLPPGPLLPK